MNQLSGGVSPPTCDTHTGWLLQLSSLQLRTAHSRLRHHIFTKFCTKDSTVCLWWWNTFRSPQDCQTRQNLRAEPWPVTVEHFQVPAGLSDHQNMRAEPWPADTAVREKISNPVENLQRTAAYVWATGGPVWMKDEEERNDLPILSGWINPFTTVMSLEDNN